MAIKAIQQYPPMPPISLYVASSLSRFTQKSVPLGCPHMVALQLSGFYPPAPGMLSLACLPMLREPINSSLSSSDPQATSNAANDSSLETLFLSSMLYVAHDLPQPLFQSSFLLWSSLTPWVPTKSSPLLY